MVLVFGLGLGGNMTRTIDELPINLKRQRNKSGLKRHELSEVVGCQQWHISADDTFSDEIHF